MALIGVQQFKGRQWAPGIKIGGVEAPPEELIVDPNLPPLGMDPRFPTSDQIVIPRGRLVAIRPDGYTYEGRAVVTIADGASNVVAGYTESNILRKYPQHDQWTPTVDRKGYIELPYIRAINDAYSGGGALQAGDRVMAYYGSVLSLVGNPQDKGKVVKWVERTLFAQHAENGTDISLLDAIYPAFPPRVVAAYADGVAYDGVAASLAWDGTNFVWIATFASGVTDVLYTMGAGVPQIAGEVWRAEPISNAHRLDGWLQWVTDDYAVWDYPPQLLRVPTTPVTGENPTKVSDGVYQLAHAPVAPYKPAEVRVTGYLTDETGATSTLTATPLALADLPMVDYTLGQYYSINPVTGQLFIAANIQVTSVRVDYSYESAYRDGRLYAAGIVGITDGQNTGIPGTPANLDVINGVGALRIVVG